MPTMISTMAPVPRFEPPVAEGFEADREEEVADESITDSAFETGRAEEVADERITDSVFETGRAEEVADGYTTDAGFLNIVIMAGKALDVSTDAEMDVLEPAEDVGPPSTPWLQITALDCGESSTLKNGPRKYWSVSSEAL